MFIIDPTLIQDNAKLQKCGNSLLERNLELPAVFFSLPDIMVPEMLDDLPKFALCQTMEIQEVLKMLDGKLILQAIDDLNGCSPLHPVIPDIVASLVR